MISRCRNEVRVFVVIVLLTIDGYLMEIFGTLNIDNVSGIWTENSFGLSLFLVLARKNVKCISLPNKKPCNSNLYF